jgi:uncharacterized protein YndB with AHSA1/START domain
MKPDLSRYDHDWPDLSFPPGSAADAGAPTRSPRSPARARDEPRRRAALATLRLVRRCPFDAASVFAAWVEPAVAGQWLFATASRPMVRTRIDARVGGCYCLTERRGTRIVEHRGEYVDLAPPRRLAFTLSTPDLDGETRIAVDIELRPGGCALTLTHASIQPDEVARVRQRWLGMLHGLGATLDLADARSQRNDGND